MDGHGKSSLLVLLVALIAVGAAESTQGRHDDASEIVRRALSRRCADNYTTTCLKMDLVSLVERLSERDSYEILPSVAVVRTETRSDGEAEGGPMPEAIVKDLARGLQEAGEASAVERLDEYLLRRTAKYLDSHSLSVNLLQTGVLARKVGEEAIRMLGLQQAETGRKGGGGGFGGGKKGGLGMLGAMMIMSKATVGAIAMGGLALLAGKALIVGFLSLLLSAIVGIKSLSSKGGGGSVTYEIVQKPVYSHAHSHSHEEIHSGGHGGGHHGGYRRRSFEAAAGEDGAGSHLLAYSSYLPEGSAASGTR